MADWKLGAKTEDYHTIRMAFHYKATPDTANRKVRVDWYLQPDPDPQHDELAAYYLCQDNQYFKIKVGDTLKKDWTLPPTFQDNGRTVHNGYARAGDSTDNYYNGKIIFDDNGNFVGMRWWLKVLGSQFLSGYFTLDYPNSGKLSFSVYGNFAWYIGTRRKFGPDGWVTIDLPSIDPQYVITYKENGGKNTGSSTQIKPKDETIYLFKGKNFSRQGYDLVGWLDEDNKNWALGSAYKTNKSRTFKANWNKKTYTITYDSKGGTGGPTTGKKVWNEDYIVPTSVPKKTGYTFNAWNIKELKKTVKAGGKIAASNNANYTLSAMWTAGQYKINCYDHTEVVKPPQLLSSIACTYGKSIPTLYSYSRQGYTFKGWTTDSTIPIFTKEPTPEELARIKYNESATYTKVGDTNLYPILVYSTTCYVKTADGWKLAIPFVKTSDGWKQAISYVKTSDGWKL